MMIWIWPQGKRNFVERRIEGWARSSDPHFFLLAVMGGLPHNPAL